MSTKPYYRFYLRNYSGHWLFWNEQSKFVDSSLTKDGTHLANAPANWDKTEISFARNINAFGLMREYSAPYRFVKNGRKILSKMLAQYGRDIVLKLYVEVLNSTTQDYEFFFESDLDLRTGRCEKDFFEVQVKEGGVAAKIKDNENVSCLIPFDNKVQAEINPFLFQGKAKWISTWPFPSDAYTILGVYCTLLENEAINNPILANTATYPPTPGPAALYLFEAQVTIYDVRFKGSLNFYVNNDTGSTENWALKIRNLTTNTDVQVMLSGSQAAGTDNSYQATFDFTLPVVSSGTQLSYQLEFGGITDPAHIVWEVGHPIEVTYYYYTPSYVVEGKRPFDVAQAILNEITGGAAVLDAPILLDQSLPYNSNYDNRPYQTLIMSGDSIRGASTAWFKDSSGTFVGLPALKITWNQLMKSFAAWWGLGYAVVDNKVFIKPRDQFFDKNTEIYDLGEVAKWSTEPASEYDYKTVRIGCEDQEYDELNGRDEFNTTHQYNLPTIHNKNELDLVSPIRTDMYGIYYTWLRYNLLDSTDSSSDNDLFALEITPSPVGGLYRPLRLAGNVSGIYTNNNANAFNFGLSPKRCFLRNGGFIRSMLYGNGQDIKFQVTDKNAEMSSSFSAGAVDEDANVPVNSLKQPFFKPYIFNISVGTKFNLIQHLKQNQDGYVKFTIDGVPFKIFPMEVGAVPAKPIEYEIRGLAHPDTDMTTLP